MYHKKKEKENQGCYSCDRIRCIFQYQFVNTIAERNSLRDP